MHLMPSSREVANVDWYEEEDYLSLQDFAKVHYKLKNYLNVTSLISFPLLVNPINIPNLVSSLVKLKIALEVYKIMVNSISMIFYNNGLQ